MGQRQRVQIQLHPVTPAVHTPRPDVKDRQIRNAARLVLATVAAVLLIAATGTAAAAASNAVATCQVTWEGDGYGHVCGTGPAGCPPGR